MTTSFLNKDLYHPTGEFNSLGLGVWVQLWTARAGNLVHARIFLMTKQPLPVLFIPLLIPLLLSIICCSAEAGA